MSIGLFDFTVVTDSASAELKKKITKWLDSSATRSDRTPLCQRRDQIDDIVGAEHSFRNKSKTLARDALERRRDRFAGAPEPSQSPQTCQDCSQ